MEELLEPLSLWGARCGLVPFWNVFKPAQELRKPLLLRPLFWWCSLFFGLQIMQAYNHVKYALESFKSEVLTILPTFLKMMVLAIVFFFLLLCFLPRVAFLHFKDLALMVKKLNQYDFVCAEEFDKMNDFKLILRKKRKLILFIGFAWLLVFTGLNTPVIIYSSLDKSIEHVIAIAFVVVMQTVGFIHVILVSTVLCLGQLAIAYRVRLIRAMYWKLIHPFEDIGELRKQTFLGHNFVVVCDKKQQQLRLDRLKQSLQKLQEASKHLNNAYGMTILIALTCELFLCSIALCYCIYIIIDWNDSSAMILVFSVMLFLSVLACFLTVLLTADRPVDEWQALLVAVSQTRTIHLTPDERSEVTTFLAQIQSCNFAFTAAGMFNVGKHLIPGVSASVLTYIIIMLQASFTGDFKPK